MTTCDYVEAPAIGTGRYAGLLSAIGAAYGRALQRQRDRRLIAELSRRNPRVLADMGFDPDAIYAAVESTWDAAPAAHRFPKV